MTTSARRDGGDWILDGHKRWNTNGTVSDLAVVWARTDEGIRGFLVPSDTPGVRFRSIDDAWSLRAAARSELFLEGVRLPADAVLPGATGPGRPAVLPDRGAVRHRVRRDGRGTGLLRDGAAARDARASSSAGRSGRSS